MKVISGSYDKTLKIWDLPTGRCKMTLRSVFELVQWKTCLYHIKHGAGV